VKRRRFLLSAPAVAVLAGCLGGGDSGANTDSPEGVVRSWYEARNEGDEGLADEVLHSQSPERPFESEREGRAGGPVELRSVEVVAEDLSVAAIRERVPYELSQETAEALADADNAVVSVEIGFENIDVPPRTAEHVVARENGGWRAVS
jgi:hypothetical protein